jgi:ABC-2 type transport system ATP-binding protein
MVAMATFGAMWGALSATAPRLARDRERGWLDALRLTPLAPAAVLAARICAGLIVCLPAVVAVGVTGRLAHGVQLTAGQWGLGLIALWLGTLPFVMLGIAIGTLTDSTTAYGVTMGLYFAFAALGGLWVPPAIFPSALRQVAKALPSYNQADLGWQIAGHAAPTVASLLVLAAWTAGLAAIAYWAGARIRPTLTRAPSAPDPGAIAIELSGVSKSYGDVQALAGLDLDIERAAIVALLGPNGAGKTTAIRIMLGLLAPDRGRARLFGASPSSAVAAGQVGAMLQDAELMSGVTVGALLHFIGGLYPDPLDYQETVKITGLEPILNRRTDKLSTGQAQRARFAVALIGNPRLLVLDEPTAGLDVQAQQVFWADVRSCQAGGQTVLFSTHYLEEADQNAERIVVIQSGHTVADGTPEQVRSVGGARKTVRFSWSGKDGFGWDQSQVATWTAQNRHTLLAALAMIRVIFLRRFLTRENEEVKGSAAPEGNGEPATAPEPEPAASTEGTYPDLRIHPGANTVPAVAGLPCPAAIPPVCLSDTETAQIDALTRAYTGGLLSRDRLAFHFRWSHWRRRHHARARWSHYSTRLAPLTG